MLAWSEGIDNGRQKTRNHGLWRHCRRRAIYWLLRSPSQTCHAKPKTQNQQAPDATSFFSRWWDAYRKQLGLKDFSPKSQDAVALQQIKERGAYLAIDRGDIRQATDRCSNIWASLPGAGYGQFEHKADSSLKIQRSGRNGQRDWCMSRVTAIISALVICIIVRLSWAVNHYRDNAITYKAQRDKMPENWSRERGNYWHADASAWCCCARCKIHEGVSWMLKLKMMLCVMMLPLVVVGCTSKQSVSQCVKPPRLGVDNAASILAVYRWTDYFTLRERLITMQKQLKEP